MATTMALVRAQSPAAMSRKGGRARKRGLTYKEVGIGAAGLVVAGGGAALLMRVGVPVAWATGTVTAAGALGAALTKNNARVFCVGATGGGGALLTAAALGAFKKPEETPGEGKKNDTKQLGAGGSDVVAGAPANAKSANPTRNASLAEQMRVEIAKAIRDTRYRQPQPA